MKSFNCLLSYPSLQSVHIMRLLIWILSQHEDQAHALFSRSFPIWDRGIFQLLLGSAIPSDWPGMGNRGCWEGPSSSNTEPVWELSSITCPFGSCSQNFSGREHFSTASWVSSPLRLTTHGASGGAQTTCFNSHISHKTSISCYDNICYIIVVSVHIIHANALSQLWSATFVWIQFCKCF